MEAQLNKSLYKIFLILLKYLPFLIGLVYLICAIIGLFGVTPTILPTIFYLSPVTIIVWIIASIIFKCCIWHRLPLYYCIVVQSISTFDYYSSVVVTNCLLLLIYLIVTIIFILLGMYLKNMSNVRK